MQLHSDADLLNCSEVPTGFKKMDFPVVKFDAVKAVGKDKEDGDGSEDDDNEFTIGPDGESYLTPTSLFW